MSHDASRACFALCGFKGLINTFRGSNGLTGVFAGDGWLFDRYHWICI